MENVIKVDTQKRKELSISEGIEIQWRQLAEWRTKLKSEVFYALMEYAIKDNHKAKTGYDIVRGQDLTTFVCNYKMKGE